MKKPARTKREVQPVATTYFLVSFVISLFLTDLEVLACPEKPFRYWAYQSYRVLSTKSLLNMTVLIVKVLLVSKVTLTVNINSTFIPPV
jgi:uncharacterized membrane protein